MFTRTKVIMLGQRILLVASAENLVFLSMKSFFRLVDAAIVDGIMNWRNASDVDN